MLKKFVNHYYPPLINLYTIWLLYMMFFAFNRADYGKQYYYITYQPFKSILFLINSSHITPLEVYENVLGNIILFIPYGFLGILYPKFKSFKYLFLAFFIVINILEFSQYYFSRGFAEFDDVMLNTFGLSLGYIVYKKWFFIEDK